MYVEITPEFSKSKTVNLTPDGLDSILKIPLLIRPGDVELVKFEGIPGIHEPQFKHVEKSAALTLLDQDRTQRLRLYVVYGEYATSPEIWRLFKGTGFSDRLCLRLIKTDSNLNERYADYLEDIAMQCCKNSLCDGAFFTYDVWNMRRESRWIGQEGFIFAQEMWNSLVARCSKGHPPTYSETKSKLMIDVQASFLDTVVVSDTKSSLEDFMLNMSRRIEERFCVKF